MKRHLIVLAWIALAGAPAHATAESPPLTAGFAEVDITPKLGERPVYLAGFGQNRKATGIHDPLMARAVVLKDGRQTIALVSVDLVGFFHANVLRVRKQLPEFAYILVSSAHNHEGPDTLGLWGPNAFKSGVDPDYMKLVESKIVQAVFDADTAARPVSARLGIASAPELLHDGREPYIKHDELVAIEFRAVDGKPAFILVQWNCHPETLGSKNTLLTADYVGYTVRHLREKYHCPVAYFTGTVGGLMTSLHVEVKDEAGRVLPEESYEKTERYGVLVGKLGERALQAARPITLSTLDVRTRPVFLPMDNKHYQIGRQIGVLDREAFLWKGDPTKGEPAGSAEPGTPLSLRTEVGWLRLGELEVAAIPGEIYPELVLSKVQDPPDAGADFPDAPIEPGIYAQMKAAHRMILGLANDEIGYIIPKRQWDEKPPFCYGRKSAQYGEANSVGPETAPFLCEAFRDLVQGKRGPK